MTTSVSPPFSAMVADMLKLNALPATLMTGLRFVGTPIWCVLIFAGYVTNPYWAVAVIAFLCLTDGLDGLAARAFNGQTYGGARFDELTDKLWSIITFALLMGLFAFEQNLVAALICFIALTVFAARDYHVTDMRNLVTIPSSWLGKVKTTLQMLSALCLLFAVMLPDALSSQVFIGPVGLLLLFIALGICIATWIDYYQTYKRLK